MIFNSVLKSMQVILYYIILLINNTIIYYTITLYMSLVIMRDRVYIFIKIRKVTYIKYEYIHNVGTIQGRARFKREKP